MVIDAEEKLTARVVRSSSCTVSLPELDIQVNPGSNATGYVSNVEGVMQRFLDVIRMIERDLVAEVDALEDNERATATEHMATLQNMKLAIGQLGEPKANPLTIVLLDPHGHSMILHPDATERDLTDEELAALPVGPDPAVFSTDDVEP